MKMIAVMLAGLALAGCSTSGKPMAVEDLFAPVTVAPDNFCQVSRKVRWSVDDTQETIDQARRHNAKWDRLCGKKQVATS